MAPKNKSGLDPQIIRDSSYFSELTDGEIDKIKDYFVVENIDMGEPIIFADAMPENIRILISGEVRELIEHPKTNKLMSLNIAKDSHIIGWVSMQAKKPEEFVSAATDCVFLKVEFENWRNILINFPQVMRVLNKKLKPSDIWPLIQDNDELIIPEQTKELKKWINEISLNSKSIYLYPGKNKISTLDKTKDWFFSSTSDQFTFKDSVKIEEINNTFITDDFPIRIVGIPSKLAKKKKNIYENNVKHSEINESSQGVDNVGVENQKQNQKKVKKEGKYNFYGSSDDSVQEAVACFRMIAEILNLPIKVDLIRKSFVKNIENENDKINLNLCAAIAESLGLKTQLLDLPSNLIHRVQTPSLIQLKDGELAVIIEVKREKILLARPQLGLETYKTSELIELSPTETTFPTLVLRATERTPKKDFGLKWFLPAIKKNRKPLIEVLIASLFVQMFQLMNPLIIQQIIDNVLGQGGVGTLPVLATLLFSFSIFENILTAVRTNLFIDTTNRIDISLGEQVIDHLLRLPLSYFDKRPVGELSARLGELEQIRDFLTSTALTVVLDAVFSVIYIAVMLAYSWVLTIVSLLVAPVLALLTFTVSPIVRRQLRTRAELNAKTQNHLVEVLTGIQTVKAQNFELKARWKWKDRYTKYVSESFRNAVTSTTYNGMTQFLNQVSSLAVLCVGAYLVIQGSLTLGQLIAFRIISGYVTGPLLRLSNLYQNFQQTNISLERLSDVINTPQESTEKDSSNIPMSKISGAITFEDVSFRFTDKGALNLSKVNLKIPKGKFVAIVGESGSGKSTLTKLLARLYEPLEGRIYIDDIDISKVELYSLRSQVGVVPQDSILFDGSVQDNISLTDPEASVEDVIEAAKIASAHDFIMKLPTGYSSEVGERGSNLSGGQRQRVAIARSILQNPNLLIMDESTSALDFKTERTVSINLMEYFRGKTVLFITHRLNSIVHADIIITMHQGKVEEQGTHSELMDLKGRYYSLYRQQEKYEGE